MKEKLTKNLNLKIIAVLFSVGIWVISININDPYQSKTYSVTVQLLNMASMTSAGKYVEILDDSDEITVSVRANRSVLDSFSASNILATADLTEIDANNQVPIKLNTTRISGSKIESMRSENTNVSLKVEDIKRVQKSIEINVKNDPAEGYILGEADAQQNALKISGPESVVDKVAKAAVTFDLEGAADDVSMLLPIELYSETGDRIIDSRLTTSINEVQCVATILAAKEVPLKFVVNGIAAEGYGWTGVVEGEPSSIMIAARPNVLKNINTIEIPDAVDVSNAKADVRSSIDLKKYLPEGVSFAESSFNGRVDVTAYIEKRVSREAEFDSKMIQVINVPEGMEGRAYVSAQTVTVTYMGLESVMNQLKEDEVQAYLDIKAYMEYLDLKEIEEGTYTLWVNFELPEGITIKEDIEIEVEIFNAE
ncbi:MAG: hypothetical protein IJP31_10170 [Lachnospiraceae bacterium]|nr:hypothetical protein [Lachnospiraceae bacterium]